MAGPGLVAAAAAAGAPLCCACVGRQPCDKAHLLARRRRAERLDWSLFLVGPGAEQPAARAALEDAARQAGFTPTASPELCTHVVALGGSPVEVDGALLRALLRGCAVVTPEW